MAIAVTYAVGVSASGVDESWLFERYRLGDTDTIRAVLEAIPESSDVGQFFRGVFEIDGDAARFYYDRVVALWPGGPAEPWTLERLWQYHYARGELTQAERFYNFLEQRHPDHPNLNCRPDFSVRSNLIQFDTDRGPSPVKGTASSVAGWTVQLGAFSRPEGAREVSRKMERFGRVELRARVIGRRELTVVTVGRFSGREDAARLAEEIRTSTGIRGWVVPLED